jgi:hypothetical protein
VINLHHVGFKNGDRSHEIDKWSADIRIFHRSCIMESFEKKKT